MIFWYMIIINIFKVYIYDVGYIFVIWWVYIRIIIIIWIVYIFVFLLWVLNLIIILYVNVYVKKRVYVYVIGELCIV